MGVGDARLFLIFTAAGLWILKTSALTTSRPEAASRPMRRREMTDSSPLLLRVALTAVTPTRPPATTGEDQPPPPRTARRSPPAAQWNFPRHVLRLAPFDGQPLLRRMTLPCRATKLRPV